MNEKVIYSRCSVGKGKWFWLVKTEEEYYGGKDPFAFGFARTAEEAEALAVAKASEHSPGLDLDQVQAYTAEHFKRCLTARKKAEKQSTSTTATQMEFVYRYWQSDFDGCWSSTPHRIVKKTRKKVFIDRESYYRQTERFQYGGWRDFIDRRTITLDRARLEQDRSAWSRTAREFFYTTPYEKRVHRDVPECGTLLGLTPPWTTDQVKQAFRCRVKKAHPDAGGDGEQFRSLYQAYEEALVMAVDGVVG